MSIISYEFLKSKKIFIYILPKISVFYRFFTSKSQQAVTSCLEFIFLLHSAACGHPTQPPFFLTFLKYLTAKINHIIKNRIITISSTKFFLLYSLPVSHICIYIYTLQIYRHPFNFKYVFTLSAYKSDRTRLIQSKPQRIEKQPLPHSLQLMQVLSSVQCMLLHKVYKAT